MAFASRYMLPPCHFASSVCDFHCSCQTRSGNGGQEESIPSLEASAGTFPHHRFRRRCPQAASEHPRARGIRHVFLCKQARMRLSAWHRRPRSSCACGKPSQSACPQVALSLQNPRRQGAQCLAWMSLAVSRLPSRLHFQYELPADHGTVRQEPRFVGCMAVWARLGTACRRSANGYNRHFSDWMCGREGNQAEQSRNPSGHIFLTDANSSDLLANCLQCSRDAATHVLHEV